MRFRIGYGGPEGFRHGYRGPRPHGGNMSEIERLIHLIVSLQILFGARRGGLIIPVLIIALGFGGWYLYSNMYGPGKSLEKADVLWDSGDTKNRNEAIREYKKLLREKNPIEKHRWNLVDDRDRLYRRIILHHVKYDLNEDDARDWIKMAWDEGLRARDLNFGDDEVSKRWSKVTGELKQNKGKFDAIPGLDGASNLPHGKLQLSVA